MSLAASLFSAFLAMLGKQWLNRYASTDVRGSAIERNQNRQRKLDGVVTWYFDFVMELLPLMLQIALLLLGCALSRYLWEINITVASVVLGATLFGIILYVLIVVAGTASERCPYQTPSAHILRHSFRVLCALRSVPPTFSALSVIIFSKFSRIIQSSMCYSLFVGSSSLFGEPWYLPTNIIIFLLISPFAAVFFLPLALAMDAYLLGQAIFSLSVTFGRAVYRRFTGASPPRTHALDQQATTLDLRCISWILQTSLDKAVHLTTLKYLKSLISISTDFDPALATHCFDVFIGCVNVGNCEVAVIQGLEQLATVTALCFFHAISHLAITNPTSSVLKDLNQRYTKVFPAKVDFHGHQFSHTMNAIHRVFIRSVERRHFTWGGYKPPGDEHTMVSHRLLKLARFGYQRMRRAKVPRLILRFALYSLSMDPPPPTPIIADCLSVIAIELGCDITLTEPLDERYVHTPQVTTTLTSNQRQGGASFIPDNSETRCND